LRTGWQACSPSSPTKTKRPSASTCWFSELLQGGKATPEQIEFIELVIDELTQNGVMPPERLFESPFTDVSAQGPLGVFPPTQVTRIVSTLNGIRTRAVA